MTELKKKRRFRRDGVLEKADQLLEDLPASADELREAYRALVESYRRLHHRLHKTLVISDSYQQQTKELALRLEHSTLKLRQLSEVALPLCTRCHRILASDDYWERLEQYLARHADILFSHGICPECVKSAYGKLGERALVRAAEKSAATTKSREPLKQKPARAVTDEALSEMQELHERVTAAGDPLAPEIGMIVSRYAKLQRRFDKIVSISDSYQSDLRDFNQRLELMAHTDLLTGLANRWEMVNRLEIEKSRCERHGTTFSLIMTDVDRFKEINDTFGHLAGDRVLREIALRLKSNCRTEDLCVRWGGDEFVILLPETNLRRAAVVADKLSHALQDVVIPWEQHSIRIGMSFGVGEFDSGGSIDDFINRVDNSLYRAKKAGKSGVAAEQGGSTAERAPADASGAP
jgi:diguanylate cyclase (GGDEF)-like protein